MLYPLAVEKLIEYLDKYEAEEIRLNDVITGFVDPNEDPDAVPTPPTPYRSSQ